MKDYKQCPICLSVQKSGCSKKSCRNEDRAKTVMIRVNLPSSSKTKSHKVSLKRKIDQLCSDSESESDGSIIDDYVKNMKIPRWSTMDEW